MKRSLYNHSMFNRINKNKERKNILAMIGGNKSPIITDWLNIVFFLFSSVIRLRMQRKSKDHDEQETTELEPERILVHKLVDSSKAQRTKAVERLKLWINARTLNPTSFFTYEDLIKIWKGLYYNLWMADKPVLQVIFYFIRIFFLILFVS